MQKNSECYYIDEIQTIGGNNLSYSLDDTELKAMIARTKPAYFDVGEHVVFIASIRTPLSATYNFNAGQCWSFTLLGLENDACSIDWVLYA